MLFHYIGDHTIAALVSDNAPHGNCKRTTQPFIRTLPIILQEVKEHSALTNDVVQVRMNLDFD